MTHELKCWPHQFQAIVRGQKRFELRRDDRGFKEGDSLFLREFDPDTETYSGRSLRCPVTYILREGFDLPGGLVVLSLGEPHA